jgi:hypothetical protein
MSAIRLSLLEWACNRYGKSPRELMKQFSWAEVDLLFDAHWWINYVDEEEKPSSEGKPNTEYVDATNQSSSSIMDMLNAK